MNESRMPRLAEWLQVKVNTPFGIRGEAHNPYIVTPEGELVDADGDCATPKTIFRVINNRHQITHDIKGKEPARPPLGIMPRYLAAEERYHALLDAICRNWGEGIEPDPEWIEEAWDMCQQAQNLP